MATVYLAHDQRHDRKVAIKVLKPELAAVLGAERFVVEIKTTASLQHPHILPLFDSGSADGFLFYVMPYIQGETIREKLNRETQFGVDEALRIAREIADALDYAHRHGVIHRDIKPENLLLHDGRAMVMDFGIALAVSAAAGGRMTETGLSLGTPHYMSPEQATVEKEITGRTDVYSLASVLYEMLTGEPPHMGNSAQQIIMKIITETPQPVTALRKSVPPNVAAAVAKALEKLPADRFESAKAFSDALQNPAFATAGTGVLAAGATARGRRTLATWTFAAVSLATLAIGYVVGRGTASAPEPRMVQFLVEAPDSILAVNRCCGPAQVLSPDGSTLVYVGMRPDGGSLYRRSLDRLTSERIPGTDNATVPFFSPNGQWVAFEADGQLKKVSMSGGPALPIAAVGLGEVSGGGWGDDDVIVYTQRGKYKLLRVPAAGGKPIPVPTPDSVQLLYPFVLPGAKHALVSVRRTSSAEEWRIGVVDLGSGAIEQLGSATRVQYANGSIVYAAMDNTLLAQRFDLRSRKTTGQAIPIATGVSMSGNVMHEFSLSTNGLLEYELGRGDAGEQLRVIGAGAGNTISLPGRRETNLEDPAISPDGRHIVLRLPAVNADFGDLWIIDRQNGTLNRLTVGGGAAPSWSRDGRFIAYYAPGDSTVKAGIYVRPLDQPDASSCGRGTTCFLDRGSRTAARSRSTRTIRSIPIPPSRPGAGASTSAE